MLSKLKKLFQKPTVIKETQLETYFERSEREAKERMQRLVHEGVASLRAGKKVNIAGHDALSIAFNIKKQFMYEEQLKLERRFFIHSSSSVTISYDPTRDFKTE